MDTVVDSDEAPECEEFNGSFTDPFDLYGRGPSAYASIGLQEELIGDPLVKGFCNDVIRKNGHIFQNKVVLEVDCGLGILSMVVSRFAKKVIAVERSRLADLLSKSLEKNKIENVRVIKGDIDEIESLPEEVDILMSQYMGFLLYDKPLLGRFLRARDKFLKPKGIVMPNYIHLLISGAKYGEEVKKQQNREHDVKGRLTGEAIAEIVPSSEIITDEYMIRRLNLRTVRIDNYNFRNKFCLYVCRSGRINSFVLHFEIGFTTCHKEVILSTSPFEDRPTRWKHVVLRSKEPFRCLPGNFVCGEFAIKESKRDEEFVTQFVVERLGLLRNDELRKLKVDFKKLKDHVNKRRPFGQKTSTNVICDPVRLTQMPFRHHIR